MGYTRDQGPQRGSTEGRPPRPCCTRTQRPRNVSEEIGGICDRSPEFPYAPGGREPIRRNSDVSQWAVPHARGNRATKQMSNDLTVVCPTRAADSRLPS